MASPKFECSSTPVSYSSFFLETLEEPRKNIWQEEIGENVDKEEDLEDNSELNDEDKDDIIEKVKPVDFFLGTVIK